MNLVWVCSLCCAFHVDGLNENNRTLEAFRRPKLATTINVTSINLDVVPMGLTKGYCDLGYEFAGWNAFADAHKANENKSL